jgi:hypothetical protein
LTWLGHQLVAWGWRLQQRYRAAVEVHPLQVANHVR